MRLLIRLTALGLGCGFPLAAQTACSAGALTDAARAVADIRHHLQEVAVSEADPVVPPAVATSLGQLKDALSHAAEVAFACASSTSAPEQAERSLAEALHANLAPGAEATVEAKGKKDIGAYGSDLSVQIFQLYGTPKIFEVDFRYGIECGDDNLLLVYAAGVDSAHPGWQRLLRWDAPGYRTVDDALGEFVMLTPLTGDYHRPTWRFVVAHGHPSCARMPRPTRFDIDLLKPSDDGGRPAVDWHFDHRYTQTRITLPRLSTTEDTIDFRIQSRDPQSVRAKEGSPKGEEIYRFRLAGDGHMEPLPASTSTEPLSTHGPDPATTSPH